MATLLLISPPVLYAQHWMGNPRANKPHLASLSSAVADLCDVRQLELDRGQVHQDAMAELLTTLMNLRDDLLLVGVSCWTSGHYLGAVQTIDVVRQVAPDVPIVVGGHHPTAVPADFDGLADWVVLGDGEGALRKLCEERPKPPDATEHLQGAALRHIATADIDWNRYGPNGTPQKGLPVWLTTSRGCPFKCRYCLEPLRGTTMATWSVSETLAILDRLMDSHAPTSVAFADPLFGANRAWTGELLDGLRERAYPTTFWAQTRADVVTRELLERYARLPFKLDFGLDAASLTMATVMEKSPNPAKYLARSAEILRVADEVGLLHGIYLIFNYPGETPETTREAMRFIEALSSELGPTAGWLSAQTFFILPGTESYRRLDGYAKEYGTVVAYPQWWRQPGDQYAMATSVIPHRDWRGREAELRDFGPWSQGINRGWARRQPPELLALAEEFLGRPFIASLLGEDLTVAQSALKA